MYYFFLKKETALSPGGIRSHDSWFRKQTQPRLQGFNCGFFFIVFFEDF
jgi:hypothetical protein